MKFQNTLSLAALLGVSSSHTIFTQLTSGGITSGASSYHRLWFQLTISSCWWWNKRSFVRWGKIFWVLLFVLISHASILLTPTPQPITDVTSNYIACNGGPNPTTATSKVINVAAGSTVQATWRHTLTSGSDDVVDPSHKVWMQEILWDSRS